MTPNPKTCCPQCGAAASVPPASFPLVCSGCTKENVLRFFREHPELKSR
jgi:hypothetical protein